MRNENNSRVARLSIVYWRRLFSTRNSLDTFLNFYGLKAHLLLNLRRPAIYGTSSFPQFSVQLHERFVPPFCLFWKFHSPVSELIHLARCVKFNPHFIPGIMLIVLCGTQSNRRTNFIPRSAGFNPRLALIGFSGTGARCFILPHNNRSFIPLSYSYKFKLN